MRTAARRIVIGYDGSEAAQRALDVAADLAGYGSTLAVVSVAGKQEDDTVEGAIDPQSILRGERLLDEAREQLLRRQVRAHYVEPVGEPAEMLVAAARELEADLLVVGRRNQNALQRLVLGSVSSKVVNRAPCDVLVVR